MKLTQYSVERIHASAAVWTVDLDYRESLICYLVYGFQPGSFWSAVLANDFRRAVQCSHPANTVPALKAATGWIWDSFPAVSRGTPEAVNRWLAMTEAERRGHLELCGLIHTEREEVELLLQFG